MTEAEIQRDGEVRQAPGIVSTLVLVKRVGGEDVGAKSFKRKCSATRVFDLGRVQGGYLYLCLLQRPSVGRGSLDSSQSLSVEGGPSLSLEAGVYPVACVGGV